MEGSRRPESLSDVDPAGVRRPSADSAKAVKSRARAAREGRRYLRFSRVLRIVLPAVAIISLGVMLIWPQVQPRVDRLRIGMASLDKLETEPEGLVNARLSGSDAKDRPFVLTAEFVRQIEAAASTGADTLGLDGPRGEITMEDGSQTVVSARAGVFDQDKKLLKLTGDVVMTTGDGSRYETSAADIDLSSGAAWGSEPVRGKGPLGTVSGGSGFRITNFGEDVFVNGRSTLVVFDQPEAEQPS